jgi:hypothetical protein
MEISGASDSSKFYIPAIPSPDAANDNPTREIPVVQEVNTIGFYIYTIDGSHVSVDYYSAQISPSLDSGEYSITSTPTLAFARRETFGYSLNGKEFLVNEGKSYTSVQDSFEGTNARILDGINRSEAKDGSGRVLTKAVDTGWASAPAGGGFASNVLTLWGMAIALGREETDIYTLSMTYDPKKVSAARLRSGNFVLATKDPVGKWMPAVEGNHGGDKKFVAGPWHAGYGLGSYGVDPKTQTVWAVVNHEGEFAARDLTTTPRHGK